MTDRIFTRQDFMSYLHDAKSAALYLGDREAARRVTRLALRTAEEWEDEKMVTFWRKAMETDNLRLFKPKR